MLESTPETSVLPRARFGLESGRGFELSRPFDTIRRQEAMDRSSAAPSRRMASDRDREQEALRIRFNFDKNRSERGSLSKTLMEVVRKWWPHLTVLAVIAIVANILLGAIVL